MRSFKMYMSQDIEYMIIYGESVIDIHIDVIKLDLCSIIICTMARCL